MNDTKPTEKLGSVRLKDKDGWGQNQENGIEKNVIKLRFLTWKKVLERGYGETWLKGQEDVVVKKYYLFNQDSVYN